MSEPVSNAEIEDVLSSIRRLVSENTETIRPVPERPENTEKLVLTPAFRVLDGDLDRDTNGDNDAPEEGQIADGTVDEAADTAQHMPESPPEDVILFTDNSEPKSNDTSVDSDLDLGQKIAALEAAIGDSQEEWEPDGSEQEDATESEPILLHRISPSEDIKAEALEVKQPSDVASDESAEIDMPNDAEDATADDGDASGISESDPIDILEPTPEDGAFLDEEMLRQMVTELVREELRGHIGERITRNVRRLVHREIKRALAVRDLE